MQGMRRYLLTGLGFAIGVLLLGYLAGPTLLTWLGGVRAQAADLGIVVTLVIEPLVWVFSNPLTAGALALVAWPLLIALLAGLFTIVLIAYGMDAVIAVRSQW
jgi:hypothetical protein